MKRDIYYAYEKFRPEKPELLNGGGGGVKGSSTYRNVRSTIHLARVKWVNGLTAQLVAGGATNNPTPNSTM